jgi:hypothetical protein
MDIASPILCLNDDPGRTFREVLFRNELAMCSPQVVTPLKHIPATPEICLEGGSLARNRRISGIDGRRGRNCNRMAAFQNCDRAPMLRGLSNTCPYTPACADTSRLAGKHRTSPDTSRQSLASMLNVRSAVDSGPKSRSPSTRRSSSCGALH